MGSLEQELKQTSSHQHELRLTKEGIWIKISLKWELVQKINIHRCVNSCMSMVVQTGHYLGLARQYTYTVVFKERGNTIE